MSAFRHDLTSVHFIYNQLQCILISSSQSLLVLRVAAFQNISNLMCAYTFLSCVQALRLACLLSEYFSGRCVLTFQKCRFFFYQDDSLTNISNQRGKLLFSIKTSGYTRTHRSFDIDENRQSLRSTIMVF